MTERYRDFKSVDDDALDIDPKFARQVEELFFGPEELTYDLPETELAAEAGGSWLSRIPLRKAIGTLAAGAVLATGGLVASSKEATADTPPNTIAHHVYRTDGDGVWLHDGPGLYTPKEVVMPEGAEFDVQCFNPGGDPVNGNALWLTGLYNGRQGSTTDYYVDTHWKTTEDLKNQGIPECGQEQQEPNNTQSYDNSGYNRDVAAAWSLDHSQDPQTISLDQCTWFASQSLWAGGLARTPEWNDYKNYGSPHIPGTNLGSGAKGTADAWLAPRLISYIEHRYPNSTWNELSFSQNSQPDAQKGDIIAYDWDGDTSIDHIAVVVDDAPGTHYPEVAEQGNVAQLGATAPNQKRGWTYSTYYGGWIETVKRKDGSKAYPNPHAYLLHIVTVDY